MSLTVDPNRLTASILMEGVDVGIQINASHPCRSHSFIRHPFDKIAPASPLRVQRPGRDCQPMNRSRPVLTAPSSDGP